MTIISRFLKGFLVFWFLGFSTLFADEVRGLWVECEGTNQTLSSRQKLNEMIQLAKDTGVNTILLQVYRHNRSWYDSKLADPAPFRNCGFDPLGYTIQEAHKYGIMVHAWMNMYRIGKDLDTPIIRKLGKDIITRDGRGNMPVVDGGYWLDPGDLSVQEYLLGLVKEVLLKYPGLDGIHLDFIRYPYTEITPGSQFSNRKDFGYGKASVDRFRAKYGYSPLEMDLTDRERALRWDNWRRGQITGFVEKVYKLAKGQNPKMQVSCAVQPWTDRAYLTAYQDWHTWLEENIVDFVITMNYSIDRKLTRQLSEIAVSIHGSPSAYIGLGAYLLLKTPDTLYLQIKDCQALKAKGIVLFSYDAMLKNKDIFKSIAKNKWWKE